MSDDINPTRSPTLTDLLQGGENMTYKQGSDLAKFRLDTFNQMMHHAAAYQIVRKAEGSITAEECTSIIQGYHHIQSQLIEADSTFCCEDCGQGSPYLFSNDDGVCSWCCAGREDNLKKIDDGEDNDDDDEQLYLDDYQDHLKHFGASYQPTNEEVLAVMQEIEDSKTYCPSCGYNWAHNPHDSCPPRPVAPILAGDFINTLDVSTQEKVFYALTAQLLSPDEIDDAMNSRLCDLTDTIPSTIEELLSMW
jgi:hypothetical protein